MDRYIDKKESKKETNDFLICRYVPVKDCTEIKRTNKIIDHK